MRPNAARLFSLRTFFRRAGLGVAQACAAPVSTDVTMRAQRAGRLLGIDTATRYHHVL